MKYLLFFLSNLFSLICCAQIADSSKVSEEDLLNLPSRFIVSHKDDQLAWARVEAFIGRFSAMRVIYESDYVIETYNPSSGDKEYRLNKILAAPCPCSYWVSKLPIESGYDYNVKTYGASPCKKECQINEKVLSYYIISGIVLEDFIK